MRGKAKEYLFSTQLCATSPSISLNDREYILSIDLPSASGAKRERKNTEPRSILPSAGTVDASKVPSQRDTRMQMIYAIALGEV